MRKPFVAGQFYPETKQDLERMIKEFDKSTNDIQISPLSGIAPHAGYIYSGKIATITFKAIKNAKPESLVIIGPDHVGLATQLGGIAVYPDGYWETPLGKIEVNKKLAGKIIENCEIAYESKEAHEMEHSIEVQLPLAQYFLGHIKIVPIMMGQQDLETSVKLGKTLAKTVSDKTVVLASSDMSHYVPVDIAKENDIYALEALVNMDEVEFYRRLAERKVSACGYGPSTAAMIFAREKGAKKGEILAYTTSGEVTGDPEGVGYASVVFTK